MRKSFLKRYVLRRFFVGSFLCLVTITTACFCEYNIHEVKTLELLEKEVSSLDEDCLVVFDVGGTLLIGADCISRSVERKNYFEEITKDFNKEELEDFFSRMLIQKKLMLVSKETSGLIKKLQEKEVKIIALTASTTGRFGVIEKTEDKKFKELKDLDIDFSSAFPNVKEIEFVDLEKDMRGSYLRFKKGMLFGRKKGEVLGAFLKKIKFIPRRLIFVDNKIERVNDVAQMAKKKTIEFLGLHYTAVKALLCRPDEEVVKLQVNTFATTGKWLNDEQAKKKLINSLEK